MGIEMIEFVPLESVLISGHRSSTRIGVPARTGINSHTFYGTTYYWTIARGLSGRFVCTQTNASTSSGVDVSRELSGLCYY